MTIAWYWGLVNALLVTGVIWLNGHGRRVGWLAGVVAQAWIVAFGLANGSAWFVFSVLPLTMFAYNWWHHPARMAELKADMFEEFADRVAAVAEAANDPNNTPGATPGDRPQPLHGIYVNERELVNMPLWLFRALTTWNQTFHPPEQRNGTV
jgi:hypothetical protein